LFPAEEYVQQVFGDMNLRWKNRDFLKGAAEKLLEKMEETYEAIARLYVPGETVVAAQSWVFGARLAHDKLGVPLATIHTQPLLFGSVYDRPRLPIWARKLIRGSLHFVADLGLRAKINHLRRRLSLRPVRRILRWWHSPQMVLGLFPDWFTPPQPDWPPNSRLVGFPLFEPKSAPGANADEMEKFIAEGEPPLLFSQGSAMRDARDFFAVSARAAQLLGHRALLLTPHANQVPASLPPGVRYFGFVPFRLPQRAAAHVHHGGMGTMAYTLAAGIPQLTMPLILDQHDNCRRLHDLGVSALIRPNEYRPEKVAHEIKTLLDSPVVAERCRFYAAKCREMNALQSACIALEELLASVTFLSS
jgi:UDP:flavonoid glycosyltransferase YjiC (YdhE family)